MLLEYILKNFLFYFLPLAVSSTIALLTSEKIRARKKIILWGNLLYLIFIIIFSLCTQPLEPLLQIEWTFYALKEESLGTYQMHPLLGEGTPPFLGLEEKQSVIKGIPIVHSGEHCQMRIKLNRRGYVYIFHFDTTFTDLRQLFPSEEIQQFNPVQPDIWVELPSATKTWQFDQKPCLEVFLAYINLRESNAIKEKIEQIIEKSVKSSVKKIAVLDTVQNQLMALSPINITSSGEFAHNLTGVKPPKVKTYTYLARDGQSALLMQFVRHEP